VTPSLFFSTLENFSMKKTLIALAAVAVSSAAMAQVTVSGTYGFGHESVTSQANSTAAKTTISGLRNVNGNIRFTAAEDIGNGLRVNYLT
jgi:predicted porin